MSLKILFPIKYAQAEPESQTEQWARQRLEDEDRAKAAAQKHKYQPWTKGSPRGLRLVYKPQQGESGWQPGEFSHMSFPILKGGNILTDPSKAKMEMTQVDAAPGNIGGKEREHYRSTVDKVRQLGAEPVVIGGEEIPQGYEILIPDPLDFFLEPKSSGQAGWLADIYSGARAENEPVYAYLHPSLLKPEAGFTTEEQKAYAESGPKDVSLGLFFMNMINHYLAVGNVLRNHPELNDEEYILKNFWVKQMTAKNTQGQDVFMNRAEPTDTKTIYGYLYHFAHLSLKRILAEYGHLSDVLEGGDQEYTTEDVIEESINNVIRKLLSGYFNKNANTDDPTLKGRYLVGFIKDSIKNDLLSFFSARFRSKQLSESEITNDFGADKEDKRGLEDTIADSGPSVEDQVMADIKEEYEEAVSDETQSEESVARIRTKQNEGRRLFLSQIKKFATQLGTPDILTQWNQQFKDFLVNHKTNMSEDMARALPKLLPIIDFNAGILPQNAFPCPNCGETFINEEGRLEPAMVKSGKGTICRICNEKSSRPDDLSNALTIPLLAFLETKKMQYLKDKSIPDLEDRVYMAEQIDRLMTLNHLKTFVSGPSRYGKSVAGKQVVLFYRNGKMFLKHATNPSPELDTLLSYSELSEIPLSAFLAGVDFPLGGFNIGYDRSSGNVRAPFGERSLGMTPSALYERNEILQAMISQELLPLIVKDPNIQKMFGGLKPVELLSNENIKRNIKVQYLDKVMNEILSALNNMEKRVEISGKPIQSYSQLLEDPNSELLRETIYQLSRRYSEAIPGENAPASGQEMFHLLERAAYTLDTIASLSGEDISNLPMSKLLEEDPAAREDPWYQATESHGQFLPGKEENIDQILGNMEGETEKLTSQENKIESVMAFIQSKEEELKEMGLTLPKSIDDLQAISQLVDFLINNGILDMGVKRATIKKALERIGLRYKNTLEIYKAFYNEQPPTQPEMVDLSGILASKTADRVMETLINKNNKQMPNAYSVIESSPLVRMLYYMSRSEASFSITDFLQMILVSSSGMFGIAENYDVGEEYFAKNPEDGEPIRFNPSTEDAVRGGRDNMLPFDAAYREQVKGTQEFPIGHPRMVSEPRYEDPYGEKSKPNNYMLFADQFSSEAIANNPRYSYYFQELAKMDEFQGMQPKDIVDQLKVETTNFVKTLYMDPNKELFQDDPITSMRAIASFFVPADLIDACSDAWARKMAETSQKERIEGQIQNPFYQASSILFDIYDMIYNSDILSGDKAIVGDIITKYFVEDVDWPGDSEWVGYLQILLDRIVKDIREGKGCASRAIKVIGDKENLKYLSTKYKQDFKGIAERNAFNKIKTLIRLASKQVSKDILYDLCELEEMINNV